MDHQLQTLCWCYLYVVFSAGSTFHMLSFPADLLEVTDLIIMIELWLIMYRRPDVQSILGVSFSAGKMWL